jgi:hypothetical protein
MHSCTVFPAPLPPPHQHPESILRGWAVDRQTDARAISPRCRPPQKSTASNGRFPQVYLETQPLIRSVVDGYNVCIFAYGQTGSGKTHTMSGTNIEQAAGRGINYRALDDLFDLQHQRRNEVQYTIRVQMLEIYNESVR